MKVGIKKPVILMAFFFSFTPFFSFYPLPSDLQPLYLLMVGIIFLLNIDTLKLNFSEILFFSLALFSILYIDINEPYFDPRKSFGLLMAFFGFYFFSRYGYYFNQKILFYIVLINFLALLIHYLSPGFFIATLGNFVRVVKITSLEGARGASGFSAEPGFMGGLAVFYLATAFYLKETRNDSQLFKTIVILSTLMIFMTRSGTGALLLVLFLIAKYAKFNIKSIIIAFVLLISLFLSTKYFDLGRAGYSINQLFTNPQRLFLVDTSVGQRVMNVSVGVLSIFEYPLGTGAGSFERTATSIIYKYDLSEYIAGKTGNVSAFAKYSVELGLLFWLFLIFIVYRSYTRLGLKTGTPYVVIALFFISASFSIAFPPVWYLLSMSNPNKQ